VIAMTHKKRLIYELAIDVSTTLIDILGGECRLADKCMEKVAITRAIQKHLGVHPHESKVRIDGSWIMCCIKGWRYKAPPPKMAKKWLIKYDQVLSDCRRKRLSHEETERVLVAEIPPHDYKLTLVRTTKIIPLTQARKDQINAARRRRETQRKAEGRPVTHYTLRKRVIGLR
jgi:hypothetical protein